MSSSNEARGDNIIMGVEGSAEGESRDGVGREYVEELTREEFDAWLGKTGRQVYCKKESKRRSALQDERKGISG
jgi:hypothetical protein